ncbi:hypothetical protein RAMDARK_0428, partial [Rickettsia amblyommatis str. Darkwater]
MIKEQIPTVDKTKHLFLSFLQKIVITLDSLTSPRSDDA